MEGICDAYKYVSKTDMYFAKHMRTSTGRKKHNVMIFPELSEHIFTAGERVFKKIPYGPRLVWTGTIFIQN